MLQRPGAPDVLGTRGPPALQLLQVQGERQQQVAQVLAGESEGVGGRRSERRGRGVGRRGGEHRGRGEHARATRGQLREEGRRPRQAGVGGFDLVGESVLEATACSVQAEPERAEGAAQSPPRPPLLLLGLNFGAPRRSDLLLLGVIGRLQIAADASSLDVQEVAAGAEGTNSKSAKGATGDVLPAAEGGALLSRAVDEQAAVAVVTVAAGVVTAAQLRLVLGVAERNVELLEAVSELTALGVLAERGGGVGGAELRLIAGGADPGDGGGGGGGLNQGVQSLRQRSSASTSSRRLAGQQVVHQLFVLVGRQEEVVAICLQKQIKFELNKFCFIATTT